jgi:hypothetical protein
VWRARPAIEPPGFGLVVVEGSEVLGLLDVTVPRPRAAKTSAAGWAQIP